MIINILSILSILVGLCIIPTAWLIYKKKLKFLSGVFLGTFLFLVSFGCSVAGAKLALGYSPIDIAISTFLESMGTADQGVVEIIKNYYYTYTPTFVVISSLVLSYITLMFLKGVFWIFRRDVSGFGKFCDFKMPVSAMIFVFISYIVLLFTDKNTMIGYGILNFQAILIMLHVFCGLSVLDYILRNKVKFSILRILIYIFALGAIQLLLGFGTYLLLSLAVFDSIFDIRSKTLKTHQ